MAFLISAVADLMRTPNGLWEWLILKVFSFIGNYGWRIVFFTLCLKILLVPLDIFQRIKMRKNQKITERIKPQIEALQQQYANDQKTLSQKQMQLQKSEGFSYFSSCLPMIVTLVIFFYLFSGLNNISQYKNLKQYVELYDAYTYVETYQKENEARDEAYLSLIETAPPERGESDPEGLEITSADILQVALDAVNATKPKEADYKKDGEWDEEKGGEQGYKAAEENWQKKYVGPLKLLEDAKAEFDAEGVAPKLKMTYIEMQSVLDAVRNVKPADPKEDDYMTDGKWDEEKGGEQGYKAAAKAWKTWSTLANRIDNASIGLETEVIVPNAKKAVVKRYEQIKESFLWVQNIWAPDVPWRKAILKSSEFEKNIANYKKYDTAVKKLKIDKKKLSSVEFDTMLRSYDKVTGALVNDKKVNKVNGYLVLPLLSVALSFLSQFITTRLQKKSGQATDATSASSMKFMMVLMPLMMGFFALQYTAMFTLYIVMNSATTIIINVITTLAMDGKDRKIKKDTTTKVQKYGRPDPSEL